MGMLHAVRKCGAQLGMVADARPDYLRSLSKTIAFRMSCSSSSVGVSARPNDPRSTYDTCSAYYVAVRWVRGRRCLTCIGMPGAAVIDGMRRRLETRLTTAVEPSYS